MKVIDFIEQLQTVSPSKEVGFALCASRKQMMKESHHHNFPLILFKPVCHDFFGLPGQTREQAANSVDTPLIIFLAPIIPKEFSNEKETEKTNP